MLSAGVIGLGDMGSGLAKNLLKNGIKASGFDLDPVRMKAFEAIGGSPQGSPREVGEAADAVFKSRALSMMDPLRNALETEPDEDVKPRLARALAAIELVHAKDDAVRVAAIETLSQFSDPNVGSLLNSLLVKRDDGTHVETNEAVRAAAAKILEDIERTAAFWKTIESLFQGVSLGSVLLLAAIGLAITFGVMGVINMAHGEMVMLGAYTTFVVQDVIRTSYPQLFEVSLLISIPLAFLVAGAVGGCEDSLRVLHLVPPRRDAPQGARRSPRVAGHGGRGAGALRGD